MERCVELYNELLTTINNILKYNVTSYRDADNTIKQQRLLCFFNSLDDDKIFLLFSKLKIKVFSAKTEETHAVSCSLFTDELTLKFIFNNQTEVIKNQFWDKLLRLYIEIDKTRETVNTSRFSLLMEEIKEISRMLSNKVKNDILKVDVNNTTNNMLDDIVGSFQNIMSNKSNPFDNIMNITNMISDKYKSQLQNGEIQLDKIIGSIDGIIPGLMKQEKEKVKPIIIDENFSTCNVDVGKEEDTGINIGKLMNKIPNVDGLIKMVSRINTAETDNDLLDVKKDMDNYLEKELKVDMSQFNETMETIEKKMQEK